jgi:predicted amidohydrolase
VSAGTPPLAVAAFQCAAGGLGKAERLSALDRVLGAWRAERPRLLVCPELFMSGYNVGADVSSLAEPAEGPFAAAVSALARASGTAILYGYPERAGGRLYNAALCIDAEGAPVANHRKLVIPPGFELDHFAAGEGITLFDLAGMRLAVLVCYDAEFPEAVRAAAMAGAQAVLVPTALRDVWGAVARKMMPTRAFENGIYLVYCNHAGSEGDMTFLGASSIVAPDGEDLAQAGAGEEVISTTIEGARVASAQARLPYHRDLAALRRRLTHA